MTRVLLDSKISEYESVVPRITRTCHLPSPTPSCCACRIFAFRNAFDLHLWGRWHEPGGSWRAPARGTDQPRAGDRSGERLSCHSRSRAYCTCPDSHPSLPILGFPEEATDHGRGHGYEVFKIVASPAKGGLFTVGRTPLLGHPRYWATPHYWANAIIRRSPRSGQSPRWGRSENSSPRMRAEQGPRTRAPPAPTGS